MQIELSLPVARALLRAANEIAAGDLGEWSARDALSLTRGIDGLRSFVEVASNDAASRKRNTQ